MRSRRPRRCRVELARCHPSIPITATSGPASEAASVDLPAPGPPAIPRIRRRPSPRAAASRCATSAVSSTATGALSPTSGYGSRVPPRVLEPGPEAAG